MTGPATVGLGAVDRAILALVGGRVRRGRLSVHLPDGSTRTFSGGAPGPATDVAIRDTRILRRLAANGAIGLADGYFEGEFEADDLAALIELGALHLEPAHRPALPEPVIRASQAAWRLVSRAGLTRGPLHDIVAHYDLGNDFYATWLDPTMTYSSGVFTHPDMTLEEAQREKHRRLAAAADVRADHRVLEIGSGWGGFALYAAGELGAQVTTVTVSREQAVYLEKLAADRGLADRIEVRLEDFTATRGSYDRVISIEMIESLPKQRWPAFLKTVRARLEPGGLAGLQIITVADRHWASSDTNPDFIRRYIFPGGQVPSPRVLRELEADHGLTRRSEETHGGSYARTLRAWRHAFDARWDDIRAMGFDDRFRRMWRYYLAYCEGGFRAGRVDVTQLVLSSSSWDPERPFGPRSVRDGRTTVQQE